MIGGMNIQLGGLKSAACWRLLSELVLLRNKEMRVKQEEIFVPLKIRHTPQLAQKCTHVNHLTLLMLFMHSLCNNAVRICVPADSRVSFIKVY